MSRYGQKLQDLEAKGRLRELTPLQRCGAGRVNYQERTLLNLSSNDYLGLGQDKELRRRFYQRLDHGDGENFALAAASSRLLTGDFLLAHRLEKELAGAYGTEAALLFNSGYHANIGILPALFGKGDLILSDKLNHASIHDGLQLSRADHKRFRHGDYKQLHGLLSRYRKQYDQVVLVSESVFSMDGDEADLERLLELKHEFDVKIYLDEAHAVGVYGENGLGKAEERGVLSDIDFLVGTFGKALASIGAFICCSKETRDYLVNHSRSFIFTTGLPPVTLNWNLFVFRHMQAMSKERKHLQRIAQQLRLGLQEKGIATGGSTNIVPVLIGEDSLALEQAKKMQELGYLVLPVRPPTVPEGTARFRFSICANMEWQDLQTLPEQLAAMAQGARREK
ncbi:7-keto-8-aminopelargonate synthetase-like enzyme [Desulfocapsa sulfexigens DSM 10523]|uniref:8-amino-7-oxononanoate synthase n=1 Tax=Desulfocapsa sulfexigens (strain DSM 10523 / SB164P1) TaxID=1167006 RepID=M1PEC3_DESSD|nr:8-amino-7-oxononanoate synthase [Desulfocapsa sulfexigens]AGF79922.1 7-keto-8-aminopelargonate synthetase-like enzyme [Desulfocapsa sulfexigens DSM 10523]